MYKLIIGNTRVMVLSDTIKNNVAAAAARQAIYNAANNGKCLQLIEINLDQGGIIEIKTTEKAATKLRHKTLKQSMLDEIEAAIKEKLFPTNALTPSNTWHDSETGQEWHGQEYVIMRDYIMTKMEKWLAEEK